MDSTLQFEGTRTGPEILYYKNGRWRVILVIKKKKKKKKKKKTTQSEKIITKTPFILVKFINFVSIIFKILPFI